MKRILIGMALALVAYCGVAAADTIDKGLYLETAYMAQSQVGYYDAVVASDEQVAASTEVSEQRRYSQRMRSDMRVASAGLVFDRADAVQTVKRLVPC